MIPHLIEVKIQDDIVRAVQINPTTMSPDLYTRFQDATYDVKFNIFNCTNLYDVLRESSTPNFQEVTIRLTKHTHKYNISFSQTENSVTYKEIETFEVVSEDINKLDQKIINVNMFYIGGAAQAMRQYLAAPSQLNSTTAFFPNDGRLSEKLFQGGFLSTKILPALASSFIDPSQPVLSLIRMLSIRMYLLHIKRFLVTSFSLYGQDWNVATLFWAQGIPSLSQNMTLLFNVSDFNGFELPIALSDPAQSSARLFDPENEFGLLNANGFLRWTEILLSSSNPPDTLANTILLTNAITLQDVHVITSWIIHLSALDSHRFEALVCQAYKEKIDEYANSSQVFNQTFGRSLSVFYPESWSDIGVLQWSTGLVVASLLDSLAPNLSAFGESVTALPEVIGGGYKAGIGFGTLNIESPELQAGLRSYIQSNSRPQDCPACPFGSNQGFLWKTNIRLFHPSQISASTVSFDSPVVLPLDVARRFLQTIRQGAPQVFSTLLQSLSTMVSRYATTFQGPYPTVSDAIQAADNSVKSAFNSLLASSDSRQALLSAGIDLENYYILYSYLYNHIGMSMTGTLLQIDPASGIAEQNSGLFSKRSLDEILFGYIAKYPGAIVPGIAGIRHTNSSEGFQALINAHFLENQGKDSVQNTGDGDIGLVGQWIAHEGVKAYKYNCDLIDPGRLYECANSQGEVLNNWADYSFPENITLASDGLRSAPLHESDEDKISEFIVYTPQVKRNAPFQYTQNVLVKGIDSRRYNLNSAVMNANATTENTWKNNFQWRQEGIPDGYVGLQGVNGGIPVLVSHVRFGLVDYSTIESITCNSHACNESSFFLPDSHDTFFDIEPTTGITIQGAKRLQVNLRITNAEFETSMDYNGFNFHYNNLFSHVKTLYVPYFWAEEYAIASDDNIHNLDSKLQGISTARYIVSILHPLGAAGACLSIVLGIFGFLRTLRESSHETWTNQVSDINVSLPSL